MRKIRFQRDCQYQDVQNHELKQKIIMKIVYICLIDIVERMDHLRRRNNIELHQQRDIRCGKDSSYIL